ncbi:hypothetical protein [Altererythrobacter lauratis]|uniref:Uncharacterized protein n=1 Tax=Alteraurantiacibacter lauratis TaxID=2054627 RepID=A0ABV7EDW0_9SPHN
MKRLAMISLGAMVAGCAAAGGAPLAAQSVPAHAVSALPAVYPQSTGNPLLDAAALLAAADSVTQPEQRAPLIERLDAMNVRLADGAPDDPLGEWRSQHQADESNPWRGRTLGPAYRRASLAAGQRVRIEQIFYAGQRAQIAAQASGGGQVAIAIANPRAEAVCQKQLSPNASCDWLPIYTERFSIELENRGRDNASVYIVIR